MHTHNTYKHAETRVGMKINREEDKWMDLPTSYIMWWYSLCRDACVPWTLKVCVERWIHNVCCRTIHNIGFSYFNVFFMDLCKYELQINRFGIEEWRKSIRWYHRHVCDREREWKEDTYKDRCRSKHIHAYRKTSNDTCMENVRRHVETEEQHVCLYKATWHVHRKRYIHTEIHTCR